MAKKETKIEKLKSKSITKTPKGGARLGAGRPKGSLSPETVDRNKVLREFRAQIQQRALKLINTQTTLAFGSQAFYLLEHFEDANGKVKTRKVLVEDPQVIENILNDPDMTQGDNYFVATIIPPNLEAIKDLLDRGLGKPTQVMQTEDEDGNRKPIEKMDFSDFTTEELKTFYALGKKAAKK